MCEVKLNTEKSNRLERFGKGLQRFENLCLSFAHWADKKARNLTYSLLNLSPHAPQLKHLFCSATVLLKRKPDEDAPTHNDDTLNVTHHEL